MKRCLSTLKARYATRELAAKAVSKAEKNFYNHRAHFYACAFCGGWHLSHEKQYRW